MSNDRDGYFDRCRRNRAEGRVALVYLSDDFGLSLSLLSERHGLALYCRRCKHVYARGRARLRDCRSLRSVPLIDYHSIAPRFDIDVAPQRRV